MGVSQGSILGPLSLTYFLIPSICSKLSLKGFIQISLLISSKIRRRFLNNYTGDNNLCNHYKSIDALN